MRAGLNIDVRPRIRIRVHFEFDRIQENVKVSSLIVHDQLACVYVESMYSQKGELDEGSGRPMQEGHLAPTNEQESKDRQRDNGATRQFEEAEREE